MNNGSNFRKNFIWNILGTGFNAFNSLFLMILVTRINGVDDAGIFAIAFSTACIFYVIGTYAGRIFQVTEADKCISDKDYIINRAMSFFIMMICTFFFIIIRRYDVYKATIFLLLGLFKGLEAFSDVMYGILQKNDLLYKVGQSYFIKAILTIVPFAIIDIITHNLILACTVIILMWVLIIIFYDIPAVKRAVNNQEKINWRNSIKIFKSGFFVFAITFLGLYILNAPKYAIDSYLESSMQTIFGIIVMPATAISLFGQFIFHPFLMNIVNLYRENKMDELNKIIRKLITYTAIVGIVSSILAYVAGIPVLNFIYGIDLSDYRIHLVIIIVAATLYNIGGTYVSILTTIRKTFIQFIIYICISVIAIVVSNLLTKSYGINGATIAYFLLMFTYIVSYAITANIILNKKQ